MVDLEVFYLLGEMLLSALSEGAEGINVGDKDKTFITGKRGAYMHNLCRFSTIISGIQSSVFPPFFHQSLSSSSYKEMTDLTRPLKFIYSCSFFLFFVVLSNKSTAQGS